MDLLVRYTDCTDAPTLSHNHPGISVYEAYWPTNQPIVANLPRSPYQPTTIVASITIRIIP
jgi:hypothetical protein